MIDYLGFRNICAKGNIDVVNSAIKDLRSKNHDMRDLKFYMDCGLSGACKGGHLNIVNLMIELGANAWDVGLYSACHGGHLHIIKLMIGRGADDLVQGLGYACMGGHLYIIEFLIEHGADNWNVGLHGACNGRQLHIIKLMIEKGANKLDPMFNLVPEMIDPDIVELISKKGISLKRYLTYPEDKIMILKLCEFGLSIKSLNDIDGFEDFVDNIQTAYYWIHYVQPFNNKFG